MQTIHSGAEDVLVSDWIVCKHKECELKQTGQTFGLFAVKRLRQKWWEELLATQSSVEKKKRYWFVLIRGKELNLWTVRDAVKHSAVVSLAEASAVR